MQRYHIYLNVTASEFSKEDPQIIVTVNAADESMAIIRAMDMLSDLEFNIVELELAE